MSVFDLALGVADNLQSRGFPINVFYGPDRLVHGIGESRIVIERDRERGDTIESPMGAFRNARKAADRFLGAKATIWAKSGKAGALVGDHERECEQYVDALYTAINDWTQTHARIARLPVSEATYLDKKTSPLEGIETWAGVVYSMRWKLPRGVYVSKYSPTFEVVGLPTGAAAATTGEVRITRNASDDPPEIARMKP